MYKSIKNYCNSSNKSGLFLLDMPTGMGKTYSVLKYIYDASMDKANEKKRLFFITTLKKNLPIEDLKNMFEKDGHLTEFNEKFLFINSNMDCVLENLNKDLEKEIPELIKKTDEYKELKKDVEFLQRKERDSKPELREFVDGIEENLRIKVEPNFRRMVQFIFNKKYETPSQKKHAIKKDKDWKWLGKLYPAVFTSDKQIIFLSMNKFLSRNITFVEAPYVFYSSELIKDAIIFIDEFDATKETILDSIIKSDLNNRTDYIDLFRRIHSVLKTKQFPAVLTTSSSKSIKDGPREQFLQSIIEENKERANFINDNYNLQLSIKTTDEMVDDNKNFLFQDHQFHTILGKNNSYIEMKSDMKERVNYIGYSIRKPNFDNSIQVLLGKISGFIKYFQRGVYILALNYKNMKDRKSEERELSFPLEWAIQSVFEEFGVDIDDINYLVPQMLILFHKYKQALKGYDLDLSFYEKGFRYYSFKDDYSHDMHSKIMAYAFQTTPEKIMMQICDKAKVVGISATATIPTVIGNYDLDYMQNKLLRNYSPLSEGDKKRLNKEFEDSVRGYKKININVELLGQEFRDNYSKDAWNIVYKDKDIVASIFEMIEQELPDAKDNYCKERYVRIALAYKNHIIHKDIQSFLCVLTKHPRKRDPKLNLDVIYRIFELICAEHNVPFDAKTICQLDGKEYDKKKDEIIQRLSNGEKLFVISVYQTIGAGQNLQYKVPQELKNSLVKTNDRPSRDEKDFDAIYLDKPTHLMVNLNEDLSEEQLVKYLFQTEYLQESAELSIHDALQLVKNAFSCFSTGNRDFLYNSKKILDTRSALMLSTRIIIQAIGRICRTNLKRNNIYIFADYAISERIDASIVDNQMLNREFVALVDKTKEVVEERTFENVLKSKGELVSARVNQFIIGMLKEEWTMTSIDKWQRLRELVLQFPTIQKNDKDWAFLANNFYVQMPETNNILYYSQEKDYSHIKIGFEKSKELNLEVSARAAKLDMLMEFEPLKNHFIENGWATDFEKNEFIMCPTLFNNIYKGALGEVAGEYLFKEVLGCQLEEITDTDKFELFDFKVKDLPIYVDFKNWHETTLFNDNKMIEKITKKAKECDCKCVLIVNLLTEKKWDIHKVKKDGITIIEIPSLLKYDGKVEYNAQAWEEIRRCINEFSD